MIVLAFGTKNDEQAWKLSDMLEREMKDIKFKKTDNADDILLEKGAVIMDVANIKKARILDISELNKKSIVTLHEFDLGFWLKLMNGINMIDSIRIIGIPEKTDENTKEDVKKILNDITRRK
jgi:hypothetical protein